jgi:N-acetylglutamate synthase-like GNAT family acetyltransferase
MRDILPRPAQPKDIATIDEWIRTTPQNLFDADLLQYQRNVAFMCAANGEPLLFMPVQSVFMLESLAVKPGATPLEVAKSIGVLIQTIVYKAAEQEFNEIYFLSHDETINAYASRHGWETLMADAERKVTLFRWKVGKSCASTP